MTSTNGTDLLRFTSPLLLSAFFAVGCASLNAGSAWTGRGYAQELFGYEVAYQDAKNKTLIGPDWQLDNYRRHTGGLWEDGSYWEEKTGNEYTATREQDVNQNGSIDFGEKHKEPIFDLRFTSRKDNGVIWVKAHPFLPGEADQELEVILDNYVDSLAGGGLYAQGNLFGVETGRVRNFTTFLVSKKVVRLGKAEALSGIVEIAEVDKLKSNPKHRSAMVQVTMVKLCCVTPATCRSAAINWPMRTCRGQQCRAPAGLLVVGYYNKPASFEKGLSEFKKLLDRFSFPNAEPLPVPPVQQDEKPSGQPTGDSST